MKWFKQFFCKESETRQEDALEKAIKQAEEHAERLKKMGMNPPKYKLWQYVYFMPDYRDVYGGKIIDVNFVSDTWEYTIEIHPQFEGKRILTRRQNQVYHSLKDALIVYIDSLKREDIRGWRGDRTRMGTLYTPAKEFDETPYTDLQKHLRRFGDIAEGD